MSNQNLSGSGPGGGGFGFQRERGRGVEAAQSPEFRWLAIHGLHAGHDDDRGGFFSCNRMVPVRYFAAYENPGAVRSGPPESPGRPPLENIARKCHFGIEFHFLQGYPLHLLSSGMEASVAQMAEQLICNQWVGGSIPFAGSSAKALWRGSRAVKGSRL